MWMDRGAGRVVMRVGVRIARGGLFIGRGRSTRIRMVLRCWVGYSYRLVINNTKMK